MVMRLYLIPLTCQRSLSVLFSTMNGWTAADIRTALRGMRFIQYAKIIGIVDVYSAMISNRVYQNKRDLLSVLKELNRLSFSTLDPQFTHSFIKHMMPNFIGKRAELTTGEIGLIVMTHPTELFHPLIQIENDFIDMTVNRQYEIKHIYI